jgi:hypothetical protein
MYYGLLALLTRALRLDARQLRNHLFRLAFVGFIYLCLLVATFQSFTLGAPGLSFFKQIAWLNALFITCAGIGFFSSAITEEKEEDTIGLLQMAGLNHLGILLGKSTSRLIQVMLLLVVQFPFMLLAVTLGGVTTLQIVASYVDLLAYTVLLANVALLCSVLFQRGGTAAAVTTLLMALHALAPRYAALQLTSLTAMGWTKSIWWQSGIMTLLEWLVDSCIIDQLADVMSTGFAKPLLTRQVVSNCVVGLGCFGLSWLLFGPSVNNASPGGASRGTLVRSTSRMKFLSPGRCWANPFIWKDFQFIGGGYLLLAGKLLVYFAVFLVIGFICLTPQNWFNITLTDLGPIYCWFVGGALILEACIFASRIFHDEIRLHTMSSLLMLPRSIPYMGYSKACGCLMGLFPAALSLALGSQALPNVNTTILAKGFLNPAVWAAIMTFLIFLHLIALLSLFIKWGALPAAIFLMGPVMSCCPVVQLLFYVSGSGQNSLSNVWGELPATITVWILTGLVCFVFQMMIAARIQELGTR